MKSLEKQFYLTQIIPVLQEKSLLQKVLFACDELAGFITAVTYVRPSKTVDEVQVKSVKKKLKDKAFARAVSREDIRLGAEELGVARLRHTSNFVF